MKKCICWCLSIIELKNAWWNIENHSVPLLEALPTSELHPSALSIEAADTSEKAVTIKPHVVSYHSTTFTLERKKNKKKSWSQGRRKLRKWRKRERWISRRKLRWKYVIPMLVLFRKLSQHKNDSFLVAWAWDG